MLVQRKYIHITTLLPNFIKIGSKRLPKSYILCFRLLFKNKLLSHLKEAQRNAEKHEFSVKRLTAMARSYWERWQWELQKRKEALFTTTSMEWLVICGQLLEAVDYLHTKGNILHNDIKRDNIVIGKSLSPPTHSLSQNPWDNQYQILLVDF